jgi:hypothetical protein
VSSGFGVRLPSRAALVLAAALAVPALTEASAHRCHQQSCVARIIVGPRPILFTSAERFQMGSERLVVRLFVDGTELRLVRREGWHGCRTHLGEAGVHATVSVCGASTPVEVRASRSWGGSVKMEIVYRAHRIAQGVKGISASSGSGNGGVASSGTGGVGAP